MGFSALPRRTHLLGERGVIESSRALILSVSSSTQNLELDTQLELNRISIFKLEPEIELD